MRSLSTSGDEAWMEQALELAREAAEAGEVPVGAVIVRAGKVVGRGRNRMRETGDPRAHAEMEAIASAREATGSARDCWEMFGSAPKCCAIGVPSCSRSGLPPGGGRSDPRGEMPERLNGAVSKTVEPARAPRVRIPLSPPPERPFGRRGTLGEMRERLNRRDWKSRVAQKATEGSNPSLSASRIEDRGGLRSMREKVGM